MSVVGGLRRVGCALAGGVTGLGVFWGGYLTLIGVAADVARRQRHRPPPAAAEATMFFRILVPAHDEQQLLGATLDSLARLDYPEDRYEVHVVADNCTDATAEVARRAGVAVHERVDPDAPGKGAALAWLIDQLPVRESGAFVVIDADTLVTPELLGEFASTFDASDPAAVQGYYTVKDAADGGDVGFRAAALAVRHFVRPAGRTALGGSSSLYGNAMAFRESIARAYVWSNELTEDLEMGMRLLLDGHTVAFAPGAVVAAEMPVSLDDAVTQNERWEAGRYAVATSAVPRLWRAARAGAHGRRWAYCDAAIDITLPPLTTVVGATAVGGTLFVALARGRTRRIAAVAACTGVGLQGAHVFHALHIADVDPEVRRSLARTPAHVLWKSRILTRVVRGRPSNWVRTTRNATEVAA